MDALKCLAELQRAGYEIRIIPEFSGFGVVNSTLLLKRLENPLTSQHEEGEASNPWKEASIMGTATVWDPESYARALQYFHALVFPVPPTRTPPSP